MDNKKFDVMKVSLPEYDYSFIFDVVDNTNIASACYLLCVKADYVTVNKVVDLITLLGNYPIESTVVTNDEFNIFIELLKQWMNSGYSYNKLNINELDIDNFLEQVNEQEYELIRSFVQHGSMPFNTKKNIRM